MSNRLTAFFAFLLFVLACGSSDAVPGKISREVILRGECTSCEAAVESVAFLGDPADTVAIRQENLPAVDSRGRFYLASGAGTAVLVFGPNGRLMTTFGKAGSGPGEFANVRELYVGVNDSIVVLGGGAVHVMSADYKHIREYQNEGGSGGFAGTLLRDGRLLRSSERPHEFSLADAQGKVAPAVKLLDIDTTSCGDCERTFREGKESGSLWSSPQNAYRIESHDLHGNLIQRMVREVAWFPSWLDSPRDSERDMIAFFARPRVLGVRQGSDGIVWTHIMMLENPESLKGTDFEDPKGMAKVLSQMITRVEGIDPVKKKLIASSKFTNVVFPLTGDLSAQLIADPSGDWAWKILRFSMKK